MIHLRTNSCPAPALRARANLLLIPLGVAFLAGVQPAAAGDGLRLHYGLRPGATYDGAMTTSMTIMMSMEGLPEDATAMLGTVGKDLRQEITVKTTLAVGGVEKDGSVPVEYKVVDGKITMTIAGQPLEIPGGNDPFAKAGAWRGRMSAEGRKLEVEGMPADLIDRLAQAMPPLPDRELKIGESFEVPVKISLPGLPMAGPVESVSKSVYTLRSVGSDDAVFDLRTTVSGSGGGGERAKMAMTVAGEGTGRAVFDRKEGIFTEMKADMKVEMTMEMPFPSGPDPVPEGENSAPKIVKIHATMSGPAEYHLSRAPAVTAPEIRK